MKFYPIVVLMLLASVGCRKVDTVDLTPNPEVFCQVADEMLGVWVSDSVWVTTSVDTLDTTYFNRFPGVFYEMTLDCGVDKKGFELRYFGASGEETSEVLSTNFTAAGGAIRVYDPFDALRAEPDFVLDYTFNADSSITAVYTQALNAFQASEYRIFFRKI